MIVGLTFAALLAAATHASAQRNEVGLIAAWEVEQKSDPQTTKFEKIADRKYHFATTRFPYDGELQIVDVDIRAPLPGAEDISSSTGIIGVRLVGASEDFVTLHEASYMDWEAMNTLYWDEKGSGWMTSRQYFDAMRQRTRGGSSSGAFLVSGIADFVWILMIALVVLLVFNQVRMKRLAKRSERSIEIAERNLQIQEENRRLFQEMLATLKQKSS